MANLLAKAAMRLRRVIRRTSLVLLCLSVGFACQKRPEATIVKLAHIYDPMGGASGKANTDWLYGVVADFERDHPGVKVELEQMKWDQIDTKCMADYRAKIAHDVVWSSPQLLAKHTAVGDLLDLTPYLGWSAEEIADFSWNPVWNVGEREGKRIAVSLGAHTRVVVYRRDLFQEVGLDPDCPPKTLEELVAFARLLTRDRDGDGTVDQWGLGMYFGPSRATIEIYFAPLVWHFGGVLWDEQSKKAVFADSAGVRAAQFLADLVHVHKVTPKWVASGAYDDVLLGGFFQGKFAMAWGWGSYWIQALEDKGWVSGVFPPTPEAQTTVVDIFETPTRTKAQFTNAWTVSIHTLSKNPELSAKLLRYLVRPETLLSFPDAGLPTRLSAWRRPEYQTRFYQVWFNAVQHGASMPYTAYYDELANTVAAALQEILVKHAPVAETLARFENEYNARYAGL
ncbi:MAG: extracellular solute-binding protein [candidate division KSB1 bacterium]|nr:extracellular solute-binding protein [candidate division KSB1 bacterium]